MRVNEVLLYGKRPSRMQVTTSSCLFVVCRRRQDVTRLYNQEQKNVQVTLIESQQILGAFDKRLRSYAEKKIRERDRFNLVNAAVVGWLIFTAHIGRG